MKTKQIKWLETALQSMEQIADYAADEYGPAAARRTVSKIRQAIRHLAQHPAMGRSGRVPNTRELIITGTPYIVAYRVKGNDLEILCVLHCSQRWPEQF